MKVLQYSITVLPTLECNDILLLPDRLMLLKLTFEVVCEIESCPLVYDFENYSSNRIYVCNHLEIRFEILNQKLKNNTIQ